MPKKKKILAPLLAYPATLLVGWFATKMSEKYEAALADIDLEYDVPDPLKVLKPAYCNWCGIPHDHMCIRK
jgi:hypothetical protein